MSDERLSKQTVNTRKSRASQDRPATEDRVTADAERLAMFRAATMQAILPDIPPIPGYHVVWLTTTNSKDSLVMRQRMGYEPVTPDEVKGFEFVADKGSAQEGQIRVNEMVAYKLPIHLYNLYMQENHHYAPAREETKLTDTVAHVKDQARSQKGDVDAEDGVEALRKLDSVRVPDYTEDG